MKHSTIYISLILISSLIIFSCGDNRSAFQNKPADEKKTIETKPSPKELEFYFIKLNPDQIREAGRTRILTLTAEQSKYLKNKVTKFEVTDVKAIMPEGWFNAQWYKPDEVRINKYMIDDYDSLIDESEFDTAKVNPAEIVININIEGEYYIKNKKTNLDNIMKSIDLLAKKYNPESIEIFINWAPIQNNNVRNKVLENNNKIKKYASEKGIEFHDLY